MNKPIIFAIDDDPHVLRAIGRDLKARYRNDYRILSASSALETLEVILDLKNKGETVAMFVSDQRMPVLGGVQFLEKTLRFYPDAKRVLLTAYADTDAAIKAINDVRLDFYLVKPWDPPEEKLYPVLDDLLDEWISTYKPAFKGIKLIGYQFSPRSHDIKEFFSGNLIPYQWLDIERAPLAGQLISLNGLTEADLPLVIFEDGSFFSSPTIKDIAAKVGLNPSLKNDIYDVAIIGAGPAGLAASVYGASEGLKTLLIERHAPGGQAGTSSRIENYLGFPSGLSGAELTRRAIAQSARFGTEFLSSRDVQEIRLKDGYKKIIMEDGIEVNARAVIITTGVNYRKLETKGVAEFTGAGIYYGAAMTEASSCAGYQVYIVGGGNSAGQAAIYLSKFAESVHILVRGADLHSTMSSYLVHQLKDTGNITVSTGTEIREARGNGKLQQLVLENIADASIHNCHADALYVFIGSKPCTGWLCKDIIKNDQGFIETGRELNRHRSFDKIWKLERDPYLLETSSPGVFAAGDVRAGAMNRVASAVGEGCMAISFVHRYLAEV